MFYVTLPTRLFNNFSFYGFIVYVASATSAGEVGESCIYKKIRYFCNPENIWTTFITLTNNFNDRSNS